MKKPTLSLFLALLLLSNAIYASTNKQKPGIAGAKAPSFSVTQWINLEGNKKTLDIKDLKGKVTYLYCFQSWCPGCHKHGFPTLKEVIKKFGNDNDVAIVAIQTTFEGYSSNSFEHAKAIAVRYDLDIPIGQSGTANSRSKIM